MDPDRQTYWQARVAMANRHRDRVTGRRSDRNSPGPGPAAAVASESGPRAGGGGNLSHVVKFAEVRSSLDGTSRAGKWPRALGPVSIGLVSTAAHRDG